MSDTFVRGDPSVNFGRLTINGACAETVARMVWAGERVDTVADEYGLTSAQVLVACWYMARHGARTWRKRWKIWLFANEVRMWHGMYEKVDDPPAVNRG